MNPTLHVDSGATSRVWFAFLNRWQTCTQCHIGALAHHKVHARGRLPCKVLFVGVGPGKTEDLLGLPFVGRAGHLLETIVQSVSCRWAIANLVACRPTEGLGQPNRNPTEEEVGHCNSRLSELFNIAKPKVLVLLGRETQLQFPSDLAQPCRVLHAYHPAYLCRLGGEKCALYGPWKNAILEFIQQHTGEPR